MANETKYAGFWMWEQEMARLDLWPRMDDAFAGRSLEGGVISRQTYQDDMAAAQEALEKDADQI
jgi:hypothetical protein